MAKKSSAPAKGRKITVDMTDVEGGSKMDDGEYLVTVDSVEQKTSDNSGNDYLNWKLKTEDNKTLYHTTSLQPQALWNLRATLEALGMEVPASSLDIDLDDLIGAQMMALVENETYQGKKRPRVTDVFPVGEEGETAEGEEAEEEEEEEEEADPLEGLTREELKVKLKESGSDLKVFKTTTDDQIREAIRAASAPEEEPEAEEEEAEEPEEEPAPAPAATGRRKKGAAAAPAWKVGDKVKFMDEGKTLSGKVASVNAEESFCEVTVGNEQWEIEFADLSKA